jgi:glycogen(starch) synthase
MEYDQFVRGCHLGVFPSYYEPWGYTPLECIARGVPAITSDLSGFGAFIGQQMPEHEDYGIYVTPRRHASFEEGAQRIADWMYDFVKRDRRDRINLRNRTESVSERFDWRNLAGNYDRAHAMAAEAVAGGQ